MDNLENLNKNSAEIGTVKMALRDGFPIGIGYFAVSFAFGIFATGSGMNVLEALFISMLNLTSAGQMAAVPIIAAGGSFLELALTQLVINARYTLMSVSLSQRLGKNVRFFDKFLIAFSLTDEMYAVSSAKESALSRKYLFSLIILPYLGWSFGTLLGALAGNILPQSVISALGIAIYGMFIAIVVPAMRESKKVTFAVFVAIALSLSFKYLPVLNKVPSGFTIIICALVSSLFAAALDTFKKGKGDKTNE
jgi:4-azaleucine resistance transporter AzlC